MNDRDEKALIALLASKLHPDSQEDLTRDEVEALLAESPEVSTEERAAFEAIDPLSLIRDDEENASLIPFPTSTKEVPDLPKAVGFNRGGEKIEKSRPSLDEARAAIRKRLESEETGDPGND